MSGVNDTWNSTLTHKISGTTRHFHYICSNETKVDDHHQDRPHNDELSSLRNDTQENITLEWFQQNY